jgi:hypothetical protein
MASVLATPLPMVFDRVVSWDFNARQCVTTTGASLTRGMFLC